MEQVIELVLVTVSGLFPYVRVATSLGEGWTNDIMYEIITNLLIPEVNSSLPGQKG